MAQAWSLTIGPASKASVIAQLNAATAASLVSRDTVANPANFAEATLVAHFNAVKSAALAAVAALVGSAPRLRIDITGYTDLSTSALAGMSGSWMNIKVAEFWN